MGMYFSTAGYKSSGRLDGKVAIITGCDTGIGKAVLREFYMKGAKIYMACINTKNARKTRSDIRKELRKLKCLGQIFVVYLDLTDLDSVRNCVKKILQYDNKIDLLVNNAGVLMMNLEEKITTQDGYEIHFATNYLGHFLFTSLLLPAIIRSDQARIINVASIEHKGSNLIFNDLNWTIRKYSPFQAYCQSKLAVILMTKELARRLKEAGVNGVRVYSLCPGGTLTNMVTNFVDDVIPYWLKWLYPAVRLTCLKTPEQGAETIIYCALDEKAKGSGQYYSNCKVQRLAKNTENVNDWKKLWEITWDLVKLDRIYNPFNKNLK